MKEERYNKIRCRLLQKYEKRQNSLLSKLDKISKSIDDHIINVYLSYNIRQKNIYLFTIYYVIETIINTISRVIKSHNYNYKDIYKMIAVISAFDIDDLKSNKENLHRLKLLLNNKSTFEQKIIKYIESVIKNNN